MERDNNGLGIVNPGYQQETYYHFTWLIYILEKHVEVMKTTTGSVENLLHRTPQ